MDNSTKEKGKDMCGRQGGMRYNGALVTVSRVCCKTFFAILFWCIAVAANAQELDAKITINHSQISGTDASVFDNLQQTLTQFVNDRQWTNLKFQKNERIQCNFNITVTKYDQSTNIFTCKALIQANRPVYNSSYTTTIYNNTDNDFKCLFCRVAKGLHLFLTAVYAR